MIKVDNEGYLRDLYAENGMLPYSEDEACGYDPMEGYDYEDAWDDLRTPSLVLERLPGPVPVPAPEFHPTLRQRLRRRLRRWHETHGLVARDYAHQRLHVWRRQRAAWFGYESFCHEGVTWLHVGWAHPRKHAWWAVSVSFDLTSPGDKRLFSRLPLWRHLPSTGWRTFRDPWKPLTPWKGQFADFRRRQKRGKHAR